MTSWNKMKDIFVNTQFQRLIKESFLLLSPSLAGWTISISLKAMWSTNSELSCSLCCWRTAMVYAVIWQLAQRFKPTNTVYANWIDVSLLLQSCTHRRGSDILLRRSAWSWDFPERLVCSLRLCFHKASLWAWYSNYVNTYLPTSSSQVGYFCTRVWCRTELLRSLSPTE